MIVVEGKEDCQGQGRFLHHCPFFFLLKHGLSRSFLKDGKELRKLIKTSFGIFTLFFLLV